MPTMSAVEAAFCRSASWGAVAHRIIVPWSLQQAFLDRRVLEIGAGDGAMAARILADHPDVDMTVTDVDPVMVAAARRRLAGYGDRADVRQADATGLPFATEAFGSVVSFLMLIRSAQRIPDNDRNARHPIGFPHESIEALIPR